MELFLFFEIEKVETFRSEKEFHETSRNLNSIRQPIEKNENNNWLNNLNELKQMLKVAAFYLEKQKSFIPKRKIFFKPYRQDRSKRWQ